MTPSQSISEQELQKIIDSAKRLGVELDEADAIQWLTAAAAAGADEVSVDIRTGTFGHKITMLDFSPEELAHFRKIGKLVEFDDIPGKVETALALSGSAAQSKIQTYPGDADFFERVNIYGDTHQEACLILAKIMRDKALSTYKGDTYELIEVKFGSYPYDLIRGDKLMQAGSPISWSSADVKRGFFEAKTPDGAPKQINWEDVADDPGWCKLDWVVVDPVRRTLVNASNMLDVTWEAPDGSITPLDGYLDGFFQEVYLEADSIPIFSKLVKNISGDALDHYVSQLQSEVKKYTTKDINYGKAAKRMYNIFRLTGKYAEAAYLRELFDEPATLLYQVWSLIRTIDDCFQPESSITGDMLLSQTDSLILAVTRVLEGVEEEEIVRMLLRLRDLLYEDVNSGELSPQAEAARAEVINLVNNFFYEKLTGVEEIKTFMDGLAAS
ncbi:MAG: hypothetical protein JW757_01650 [Anaerolineales bacterium]|nr:hypothetical protein [Anaerolineales bacterium]